MTAALAHELRRGRNLERMTVAWNCGEAVVTVGLGAAAGSVALVAFGLDSLVEVFASLVVLWHMATARWGATHARDRTALRLLAAAFGALALYLIVSGVWTLAERDAPRSSPWGIAYLAVAATAMFVLALFKYRIARQLGSESFRAEAAITLLDGCLATSVLGSLVSTPRSGGGGPIQWLRSRSQAWQRSRRDGHGLTIGLAPRDLCLCRWYRRTPHDRE